MIDEITRNPIFGISLTLAAYAAGLQIYKRFKFSFLHPILTASAIIIALITILDIPLENYQNGGSLISLLLGPATAALAVPLYRQRKEIKTHLIVILASITIGAVVSVISTILLSRLFKLPEDLVYSLIPKSVTTPIAVEVSEKLGGIPTITAIAVILTGITGAVLGPRTLKLLRINRPAAKGLAIGTSAHAIGTSRALEIGEKEGAAAGLAIGIAGIITALAAPLLVSLLIH